MLTMAQETNEAIRLVQKMYECFNKDDLDTIRKEVFAPDLKWNLPGRHPLSGMKQSGEEVIAFFGELRKCGINVDLIGIHPFGDDGCVEIHRGYGEAGGNKLDARNCTHYVASNGRLSRVEVFMGDQASADNFFNAAYNLKPIPERLAD
jgi:ketosteroid isomerase-like protein